MSKQGQDRHLEELKDRYKKTLARLEELDMDRDDLIHMRDVIDPTERHALAISGFASEHIRHGENLAKDFASQPGMDPSSIDEARRKFIFDHAIQHAETCIARAWREISEIESLEQGLYNTKEELIS